MIMVLGTHFTRASDVITPDYLTTSPSVPISPYRDVFGNWCSRIVAPAGRMRLSANGVVRDSGLPDVVVPSAFQHAVEDLPPETLIFLLGGRYCETDRLSEAAWSFFQKSAPGWARVQTICDFVHRHIAFGYEHARSTMISWEAFSEGKGVCRDYAHLAITFCRCMNIPARYCTGYLGDIGVPPPHGPMRSRSRTTTGRRPPPPDRFFDRPLPDAGRLGSEDEIALDDIALDVAARGLSDPDFQSSLVNRSLSPADRSRTSRHDQRMRRRSPRAPRS
jgi:transglutaminase-like putative cysteine protease